MALAERPLTRTDIIGAAKKFAADHLADRRLLRTVDLMDWKAEEHASVTIPVAVTTAFYGRKFEKEAIYTRAVHILRRFHNNKKAHGEPVADLPIPNFVLDDERAAKAGELDVNNFQRSSGFTQVYQMPHNLIPEQYLLFQQHIANTLVPNALENLQHNWPELETETQNIGVFAIATSAPMSEDYAEKIALAAGIDPQKTKIVTYVRACDSSGSFMYDVAKGDYKEYLEGDKIVVLYAYEDMTRLMDLGTDLASPQFFSTATSVVAYHPQAFAQVVGTEKEIPDGVECLKGINTYDKFKHKLTKFAQNLIPPEHGYAIFMNTKETTGYFVPNVVEIIEETLAKAEKMGITLDQIAKIIPHHASRAIVEMVRNRLKKNILKRVILNETAEQKVAREAQAASLDEKIEFVITEGNPPATTLPIALGRHLSGLKANDLVMFVTFGAGGWFHCSINQMHGRSEA